MYRKNDVDLSKSTLKTLLLYPQGIYRYHHPSLSIPQLHAFLESKHYKGLRVIDLSTVGKSKLEIVLQSFYYKNIRYSQLLDTILSMKLFNKTIRARFQEPIKHIALLALSKFSRNTSSHTPPLEGLTSSLETIINSAIECTCSQNKDSQYIAKRIEEDNIQLIGLSIHYPIQLYHAILLARLIKELHKDVFIVMGGALITKYVHDLINRKQLCEWIDGYIVGDGEEPLAELIYQLEYSHNFSNVSNLYFRKEGGGEYTRSNAVFHADPNYLLEPIFGDISRYSMLPIRTSYACPWGRCAFCTYRLSHPKFSQGKPEHIVKIIKNLQQKYNISRFQIIDDFLLPGFLREFSKILLQENVNISWYSSLALVSGLNESIIQAMARSGCFQVSIGLESMSPRVLKLIGKPQTPENAKKNLRLLKDAGIKVFLNIIFGFPTETIEEASMTLDFLMNNKDLYDSVLMQQFSLEENTIVFNEPDKFGITKIYTEDKHGPSARSRLGYQYEVNTGMSQQESEAFTEKAKETLKKYHTF